MSAPWKQKYTEFIMLVISIHCQMKRTIFFSSLNKNYERKMTQCSGCHYDDSKQRTQISTQRQWLVRL